ncbi:MAG: KUP/HAK/KT family potassium transporter [Bacteroidia bacterium]|nr:KUP/HAK/KT family potassium transporter [Bacteroidia bacterium]
MQNGYHSYLSKVTAAGLLVTLGIIYGDIGTSPLYVLKAIVGDGKIISADVVLGGISCIFWTLTLQTTLKYVMLTLRADNKGEGGIFALYALVKKTKVKWLMYPAIIGGCFILGDGIITPPISVASAVEGLGQVESLSHIPTIPIILIILTLLFTIQQFGTKFVGKSFGPIMMVWFLMLGVLGIIQVSDNWGVLAAVSPHYAFNLLSDHPEGFWLLGAVFLCTTGAEALYSDLGHCGRKNIRITWIFVKTMLLINYFGQGAWLIARDGEQLSSNPFYSIMPEWFLPVGITIATAAAVVASQALISGSFTLINEAVRLDFWPKVRIKYPTELKGQLYIPSVNWLLWAGCVGVVLYFKESSHMEAAYGLTIIVGMIMTSLLLIWYMRIKHYKGIWIIGFIVVYLIVESAFLVANSRKFFEGGWVSLMIASILYLAMWCWQGGRKIRNRYVEFVKLDDYVPMIAELSKDESIPKFATHLVYLTSANKADEIEQKVVHSILQRRPKRADIYWFVHVDVVDEPYRMDYKVIEIVKNDIIRVEFKLGFRVAPRINLMFRKVIEDLVANHEVDITSRYESLGRSGVIGDFRFIVIEKFMSFENEFPFLEKITLDIYGILKWLGLSEGRAFGLDTSSVVVEKFPLVINPVKLQSMKRVFPKPPAEEGKNGE